MGCCLSWGGWGSGHMGVGGCIGPGGEGGGGCAGVVAAVGREFLAACKIPHILFLFLFFFFFTTQYTTDLVIMTKQDSLLGRGSVGGLWVSLQGQGCVRQVLVDSSRMSWGILGPAVMAGSMVEIGAYIVG